MSSSLPMSTAEAEDIVGECAAAVWRRWCSQIDGDEWRRLQLEMGEIPPVQRAKNGEKTASEVPLKAALRSLCTEGSADARILSGSGRVGRGGHHHDGPL